MESICKLKDLYKALYSFEKEFALKNGITINEGTVLCCMKDDKPKSANDLCEFVGLSNSRVSRIITTVEGKGYIKREMGVMDKRQMIFTLTDAGRAKIDEMLALKINSAELIEQLINLEKE